MMPALLPTHLGSNPTGLLPAPPELWEAEQVGGRGARRATGVPVPSSGEGTGPGPQHWRPSLWPEPTPPTPAVAPGAAL